MNNLSLKQSVEAFIQEINECVDRHEIEKVLTTKDLKIHGQHQRYNKNKDIEEVDNMITEAVNARLAEFE